MTVRKDEKIFIESKPEYEGWLIAKGRERSGLVPEAYVQILSPTAFPLDTGLCLKHKFIFYLIIVYF